MFRIIGITVELIIMRLKAKYIIFILLIIFVSLVSLLPRCSPEPVQNIVSWDFFGHLGKIQFLETHPNATLNEIGISLYREKETTPYPPGYVVLFYFIKTLLGVDSFSLPYMSIFFWVFSCLLLFTVSNKLDNGYQIGIVSAVLGATFISGSNMLGPIYTAPANLDVIFMLLALIVLISIKNKFHKIFLCSLLLCVIFVTHRPGMATWLIFVLITAIFPLLFVKQKKEHLLLYALPAMIATIFALDLSLLLWWNNFPLDIIIRLGGIIPENIVNSINTTAIIFIFILLHFIVLFTCWIYIRGDKELNASYQKEQYIKISITEILSTTAIIPIVLAVLFIYYTFQLKVPITTNIFDTGVQFWSQLSRYGPDTKFETIKQILYIWHINIIALVLIVPSIYIAIRKKMLPLLIAICVTFLISLFILFSVKMIFPWDLKIQRFYIYLAPFVFILCSWGFNSIICSLESNLREKVIVLTKYLILLSLVLAVFSVNYTTDTLSLKSYNGYLFSQNLSGGLVGTHPVAAQEARGLGNFNFVARYYLFTHDENSIAKQMQKTSYEYVFIQTEYPESGQRMSNKFKNTNLFDKVFDNSNTEIYKLINDLAYVPHAADTTHPVGDAGPDQTVD